MTFSVHGLFGGGQAATRRLPSAGPVSGLGGLLDAVTNGWYTYPARARAAAALGQQQSGIFGAMPTPNDYAPPAYAAPTGPDGKPYTDPTAAVPYAERYMAWARDAAASGIDLSKTALPKVAEVMPKDHEYEGSVTAFDPMNGTAGLAYSAPHFSKLGPGQIEFKDGQPYVTGPDVTDHGAAGATPVAPTAAAPPAPAATPIPTGSAYDAVGQLAEGLGATPGDVGYLQRNMQIESGGRASAQNGASTSYFQFHPDTFHRLLPAGDINSLADQTKAALLLSQQDRGNLTTLGVEPTDANTYIMHQQGAAGGKALLTAPPEVNAVAALTGVGVGPGRAVASIAGNIGLPYRTPAQKAAANAVAQSLTAGQFADYWRQRWSGQKVAITDVAASPSGPTEAPTAGGPVPSIAAGAPRFTTPAKPVGHPSTPAELAAVGLPPKTPAWTDASGKPTPYPATGASGDDTPLTADAVDLQAGMYLKDRVLPPLGMGKQAAANRAKILNRATEIAKGLGLDANDIIAGTMSVKAAGAALNKATTLRSQLEGNVSTLDQNLDWAISLAPKGGGPTNSPVLNRVAMHIKKEYAGDADTAAFESAIGTAADEFAKATTTTTGAGGPTSDSARNEAYRRLSQAATIPQLQAIAASMKVEAANRLDANRAVEEGLRNQVRSGGVGGAAPPSYGPAAGPAANAPRLTPKGYTPAQAATAKALPRTGRIGSATNPYAPKTEGFYNNLPSGVHYIHPDGSVRVKQ